MNEQTVWLYTLLCRDGTIYVGISQNVEKRFQLHSKGKGAFYTKLRKPVSILAAQPFPSRAEARRAEISLKAVSYQEKLVWAESWPWQKRASDTYQRERVIANNGL